MEEIKEFFEKHLKMRINEVEENLITDLGAKVVWTSSSGVSNKEVKDIVQYTVRFQKEISTGEGEYYNFPFDTLKVQLKLELSHFVIQDVNYRFDVYKQTDLITWKKGVDEL